ncbi:MAG TPA: hypothetical protein VKV19_13675 [Ktedonobacteraceae bacterium]|nr:hypothetical protein [Ktedonobacteraceae bacterium]
MAQSIGSRPLSTPRVGAYAYVGLWRLRLALGWVMLLATMVGLFAVSWDVQWHTAVGRDRTLTMPHLFILGSITVTGLVALAAVLIETIWARRDVSVAQEGTHFASMFSSSLGAYLVGYGALDAAIAFPLDQYWHTLYGVDVTIWAPFHVMALVGVSVASLGEAYILAEVAQMAAQQGARGATWAGYIGVIVACATLLGNLSFLLPNALSTGYVSLGNLIFTVYPLMLGAFAIFVMMMIIRALPWPGAATSVAIVYLLFGLVNYLLIPPLMTLNLHLEQQSLLPGAPTVSVMAVEWQYGLIIPAVLLDIVAWVAQRAKWPLRQINGVMFVVASIGISLTALVYPLFLRSARSHADPLGAAKGIRLTAAQLQALNNMPHSSVVLIVVISLLLGLLGVWLGSWFGTGIGESMRRKQQ